MMDQYGVADFLEACDKILYAEFARNGFYEALGELTPDTHSIGTGYLYIEEETTTSRILFMARHFLGVWIDENAAGEVDIVDEELPIALRDIVRRYPAERISQEIKDAAKKDPYQTRIIRHRIMPMDKRYLKRASRPVNPNMPYISIWYEDTTKTILDVGGYWEMPVLVSRYRKNSGEPYGRSPGQDALGHSMASNKMTMSRLALGQRISDPTMVVDPSLEGSDDFLPGGRIYARAGQRVEPIIPAGSYPITIDIEQRTEQAIDEHFMVQIYLMLQQASDARMTAREVTERMGEKAAVLGYVTGRFQNEILQPAIKRTFNLLMRAGRLPKIPDALMAARTPGGGLSIEFSGFFAQIQKKYYATNGINSALEYAGAMGQLFGPEVMDNIDSDVLVREALDAAGAPQRAIREKQDVERLRELRAAEMERAQQAQAQAQQQQMLMQNADKLGKTPETGSPMDALAQMGAGGAL